MKVLVFIETENGQPKKASLEAVNYGSSYGEVLGAVCGSFDNDALNALGKYGANRVIEIQSDELKTFNGRPIAKIMADLANENGCDLIVMSHTSRGREIAPRIAVRLNAGIVSAVNSKSDLADVRRAVFSGKAFAEFKFASEKRVMTLIPNSFVLEENEQSASKENLTPNIEASQLGITLVEEKKLGGETVPLAEAETVVSGGRGLKGPENWGMIEELAKLLNAATACSRPVADVGWRPHHEHVGQTGLAIKPNLYIAIGISGAIQHLAGVNNSKVIVVINTDPEAPFFKAADYGIVGDAFEVVPKLISSIKQFKEQA